MIFFVVLIALLIERFFDWSHLRKWGWYGAVERLVMKKIPKASPYVVLPLTILPLLAVLAIIEYALTGLLYGFPLLVFQLLVLLYCLGPQNLWADALASINAITKGDAQAAADKLQSTFKISMPHQADGLQRELLNQIFISANSRVYAVVFWYLVLGLPGALLYRLVCVSAGSAASAEVGMLAKLLVQIMDWVPARIFSFLFALGGNFTRVFAIWLKRAPGSLDSSDALLSDCGVAAITGDAEHIPQDGSLEKSAISLLDRAFIILLVLVLALNIEI